MDNRNTRVLIVDDQESIFADFQEMLGAKGRKRRSDEFFEDFLPGAGGGEPSVEAPSYELSYASSGDKAIALVRSAKEANNPFAVAYIDIRMPPGIDGIEAIQRIREFEKDLEIVIMTAYSDRPITDIVTNMELLHKLLYIRKPVAHEEIQQITRALVEKWNLEQEATRQRQRLKTVLDANADAIGLFGEDGGLLYANRPYYELFDFSETEELSPEELSRRVDARLRRVVHQPVGDISNSRDVEAIMEEVGNRPASEKRLFYRFSMPLNEGEGGDRSSIVSYRDMSKEAQIQHMKAEIISLRHELKDSYSFDGYGLIGNSTAMGRIYEKIHLASEADIGVLIQGESGTGKELVAKAIHYNSARSNKRFVPINCAAIPDSLIESELFGHERGAFTGAATRRIGRFEEANGGTIFLDEIGDMPLTSQAKLLRVLEERRIQRVGGTTHIDLDLRVIAATNHDIEEAMKTGDFREDLYYRIATFLITIPPLRERREDIPPLANHFLQTTDNRRERIKTIAPDALGVLMRYRFPGNVRELKNIIERAVLLETSDMLQASTLSLQIPDVPGSASDQYSSRHQGDLLTLEQLERQAIRHALEVTKNNISRAARALGINRSTLHRKMKAYGHQV